MASDPALILLAGMHRSGTSLLASLLPCLAIPIPGELIRADVHNPEGYYERADITDLQERLQVDLGRWWPSASGDLPYGDDWLGLPSSVRTAQRIERCLRSEQQRQSGPWAIKDPRTSLLLPLWQQLSSRVGLPLRLVISVRDPAEVMVSLHHRDGPITGMTPWRAQRLIWRHLHQLLLDSRELSTLVVAYGDWFKPDLAERQLLGLGEFCRQQQPAAEQRRQALQRIDPRHRRSQRRAEELPLAIHPLLQELHQRLSAIARLDPAGQARSLAELRRWMNEATPRQLPPLAGMATLAAEPTPWFDATWYGEQCRQRGLTPPTDALEHFRSQGWQQGLSPCPLTDADWAAAAPQRRELWPAGRLEGLHPWGGAALALSGGDVAAALSRLERWLQDGLSSTDLAAIAAADEHQFRLTDAAFEPQPATSVTAEPLLLGISPDDPELPQWWARLPASDPGDPPTGTAAAAPLGLSLAPLVSGPGSLAALTLARAALVFDPDPERVSLLRRLGVNARLLPPAPAASPRAAATQPQQDGLPAGGGGAPADSGASATAGRAPASLRQLGRKLARKLRSGSFLHVYPRAPALHNFLFFTLRRKAISLSQLIRSGRFSSIPRIFLSDASLSGAYTPLVSVIVPNYNHAAYLEARLDSIFQQSYPHLEVILLDDASSDGSQDVLRAYQARHPDRCRLVLNKENSGSPFRQWRRGLELARGELIWIAESDDFCAPDFLSRLVPHFANPATMLAFCRIEFVAENGRDRVWSMQQYLPELGAGFWQRPLVSSAQRLTGTIWNRRNLIPNVSAALFRSCPDLPLLQDPAWQAMKICGDWLFYLHLARGGLVGYEPGTTSQYRQHPHNTSVSLHRQRVYLEEHLSFAEQLLKLYRLEPDDCRAMQAELHQRWQANQDDPMPEDLRVRIEALRPGSADDPDWRGNILIVVYSMIAGGGEILPLQLANILKQLGFGVTVLNCHQHPDQSGIRAMLRRDIPVVELHSLETLSTIIQELGIDVVHSHHPWVDTTIAELLQGSNDVAHVITSHGMYDELDDDEIARIARLLGPWVKQATYVADHNRAALQRIGLQPEQTTKITNAIAARATTPITRSSLGLDDDAFVICLASRGIREKGWQEAIEAVQLVRRRSERDVQLLILGDGKELQRLQPLHHQPCLHFLGFQQNACRYFACADLGILPSFYPGESQPLTLIECLAAGRPYLASDVGEIRAMLSSLEGLAGQVIPLRDGRADPEAFASAILSYLEDPRLLEQHTRLASLAAGKFDPVAMGQAYAQVYRRALTTSASPTC
jgi:glycosyltransferase involved in cell wall biosynthesis